MKNRMKLAFFAVVVAGFLLAGFGWWKIDGDGLLAAVCGGGKSLSRTDDHEGHAHDEAMEAKGEHRNHDGHEPGKEKEHADEKLVRLDADDMSRFGIEVTEVGSGKLVTHLSLSGEVNVNADRMAHIVPRLPGVVREVRKSVGDGVRQGEVMVVIESRELADSKAEYLAAVEKLDLAQAKFSREQGLWQKKISAEQEYLDAKQALAEARIALRSAEQKLHALGFSDRYLKELPNQHDESYTRYEVVAPFSGTVIEKHVTLGEMLKEDADIFLIADLSTVWVNLTVYQRDLPRVQKGQKAVVSAGHGIPDAEEAIAYVAPIIKEETRTALARVILPNPKGHWRPGMFVTARVGVGEESVAMLLPKTALQTVDNKAVVFALTEEGFVPKPIIIGRQSDISVEITSGISPGERYAAKGAFTLKAQLSKGAFGDGHNH